MRPRPPVDRASPPVRARGDRARPGSGHDRARPGRRLPFGAGRSRAIVPGRRRGLAGAPRPIVRPGPQHALVASLGRPDGRADRDRPRAATGGSGAHLGLPGRARPAARADARSGRARAGVLASGSERDTLALALEIQAHEADRAGPSRWRPRERQRLMRPTPCLTTIASRDPRWLPMRAATVLPVARDT